MKKTLVALAVAAVAATSANAAVLYNQNGSKVEFGGTVRTHLDTTLKNGKSTVDHGGSHLDVKASQDLGEGLKALAQTRISDKGVNKLHAGFSLDGIGKLTFGKQDTNGGDVALSDYAYKFSGDINQLAGGGDNSVIRFISEEFDGLKVGLDYVPATKAYVVSAFYKNKFNDVNVSANAGLGNEKGKGAFTFAAEASYQQATLAVDYSTSTMKKEKKQTQNLQFAVKYQVTPESKVYALYNTKFGKTNSSKGNGFAIGVDYKPHSNIVTFVEAGRTGKDNKTNVGFRVNF